MNIRVMSTPPTNPQNHGVSIYAHSPSPETPISGKGPPPPYLGYWLPLAIMCNKPLPFASFHGKSSRDYCLQIPPSRGNGNTHADHHAFGGGGGGGSISCVINCCNILMSLFAFDMQNTLAFVAVFYRNAIKKFKSYYKYTKYVIFI